MPRLYREAPLSSIWEGSGNVTALDLLRALDKQPSTQDAIRAELDAAYGASDSYDAALRQLRGELAAPGRTFGATPIPGARALLDRIAPTR